MLVLSSPLQLPTTQQRDWGSPPLTEVDDPGIANTDVPLFATLRTETTPTTTQLALQVPSYSGNTFTLSLPANIETVDRVVIGGKEYALATDPTNPGIGEYGVVDGILTVILAAEQEPIEGESVQVRAVTTKPATVTQPQWSYFEPVPDLFIQWEVQQFEESLSFEDHPSASFTFTSYQSESALRLAFCNGETFNLYGIDYRVAGGIKIRKKGRDGVQKQVTVSLEGAKSDDWDEDFKLLPIATPSGLLPQRSDLRFSTIAATRGYTYEGPLFSYPLPRDLDANTTATLSNIVATYRHLVGCYLDLNGAGKIRLLPWSNPPCHTLSPDSLMLEGDEWPEASTPGEEQLVGDIKAVAAYENTVLQLQSYREERPNGSIPPSVQRVCNPIADPAQVPAEFTQFGQQLELADFWDMGGFTLEQRCTISQGDKIIRTDVKEYGFAPTVKTGRSGGVFFAIYELLSNSGGGSTVSRWAKKQISGIANGQFWQLIRDASIVHGYDGEGYESRQIEQGRKLTRARQESADIGGNELRKLEELFLAGVDPITSEQILAQQALYQEVEWEDYEKTTIKEYSPLTIFPSIKAGDSDANSDRDKPIPRFLRLQLSNELTKKTIENPDPPQNLDYELPTTVTYGQFFRERLETIVLNTSEREEAHQVIRSIETSEGAEFERSAADAKGELKTGPPSAATRVASYDDQWPEDPATPGEGGDVRTKYLLNSDGSTAEPGVDLEDGSVSVATFDPDKGREVAELRLDIQNTRGSETYQIKLLPQLNNRHWVPGDCALWQAREYRIFNRKLVRSYSLVSGQVLTTYEPIEYELGRRVKISVSSSAIAEV